LDRNLLLFKIAQYSEITVRTSSALVEEQLYIEQALKLVVPKDEQI
jgi:hypothetical protein